jgi:hypothetical protein
MLALDIQGLVMRSQLVAVGLLMALSPLAMAGQIYKWVDAQGVTHFDAQPPAGQKVTPVDTVKPVPAPEPDRPYQGTVDSAGGDAEQRRIDKQVKAQVVDQEARRKEFCTTARTNLAQLRNNPRIRQEVDGEFKRMTEPERQAKIEEVQAVIGEQCN